MVAAVTHTATTQAGLHLCVARGCRGFAPGFNGPERTWVGISETSGISWNPGALGSPGGWQHKMKGSTVQRNARKNYETGKQATTEVTIPERHPGTKELQHESDFFSAVIFKCSKYMRS